VTLFVVSLGLGEICCVAWILRRDAAVLSRIVKIEQRLVAVVAWQVEGCVILELEAAVGA
jgi:hypothetical protein